MRGVRFLITSVILLACSAHADDVVPRARFALQLNSISGPEIRLLSANMVVSTVKFTPPKITNAVLSFGEITITSLMDSGLRVCGPRGKTRCRTAVIRLYTTGTPEPGLYNSADRYGVPLLASYDTAAMKAVGLEEAGALTMQTYAIPRRKTILTQADFGQPMTYKISADFSNAGAGSYATTLVVEYGLLR